MGSPVTRAGGKPGDDLWVTGTPGLAGAGYVLDDPPGDALHDLRRPTPPLEFALDLATEGIPTAMMDLSDGLGSDLPRLCRASATGAVVEPDLLPVHATLANLAEQLALQVSAGDDYQLLFSAPPERRERIAQLAARQSVRATRIGRLTAPPSVTLRGHPWPEPTFRHFWGAS